MRKDKGLNGDLDRLPLLTWIMFLKFLDDLEQQREEEAALAGKKFRPAIEAPVSLARLGEQSAGHHRRRAAGVHQSGRGRAAGREEGARAVRLPAAAYELQRRQSARCDRTVFRGVDNRMKSGYLAARRDQQGRGHPFHIVDELAHARRAL